VRKGRHSEGPPADRGSATPANGAVALPGSGPPALAGSDPFGLPGSDPFGLPEPQPSVGRGTSSRARIALVTAVLVMLGGGAWAALMLTGFGPGSGAGSAAAPSRPASDPAEAGAAFLAAWQRTDYAAMQSLVLDQRDNLPRAYGGMATRLKISAVRVTPGRLAPSGTDLPFHAALTLTGVGRLEYDGTVHLRKSADAWKVAFTGDTVYPDLKVGERLDLVDDSSLQAQLPNAVLGHPALFGPGATVSNASTAANRGQLLDRRGHPLAADQDLRLNVLGSIGAGGGNSGLERILDDQLTGDSGRSVVVANGSTGAAVRLIGRFAPPPAGNVRTTLDLRMQLAGEKALAKVRGKAALVAIDVPTGEVRAIVNRPVDGLPAALSTAFAPGSTFKVITATAALISGLRPTSTVSCPDTISAGGVVFHNHERSPATTLTLTEAFARSCNTAFIGLARNLPDGALASAAVLYGFGQQDLLPIAGVGGEVPEPTSPQEAAADAIGQGRVGASPLLMASVAAAVADGRWRQPRLTACADCRTHEIPVASSLRTLMREVVTSGTGAAASGVAGGPVYGKTGTAEYGSGSPPPTHAWFIGWQGRTAFAVFVQDGSSGGAVAAPIAARFLRSIGGG
jgi:hypothetical protein